MPLINFRNILSCSNEDRIHCAENLLKPEQYKKWLSSKGNDERIICIIELEKSSLISSVDIGNDGSAFIELFVSRSSSSKTDDWTVLLPATLLMTPSESRSNTNRNQVKLLKSTDLNKTCLNEKWDRLKIVCEQKFNRLNPFGLCFIKLYSPTLADETNQSELLNKSSITMHVDDDDDETEKEQNKIGSFFAKKQAEKNLNISTPSASDQIRALSNVADELLSKKPMDDKEIQTLLKKDVKIPNRLSKRPLSDESESTTNENEIKRNKTVDKSKLMKNVVFVLSGFQNPLRSELRNKATMMGAIYNDDWDETCTHLICAFPNTPKFTQVKQTGKGFVVGKQWILDCYKQEQLLSEKNYEFKGSNNSPGKKETTNRTSGRNITNFDDNEEPVISKDVTKKPALKKKMTTFDDDDDEEDEEPIITKNTKEQKKITTFDDDDDVYNAETDDDEPTTTKTSFELANFFHEKHFYVFNDDFDDDTLHDIKRVIYAYNGILEKHLTSDVKYIITNRLWNQNFDKILKTNAEIKFLSLDWLQDCHDENKLVPYQPYSIVP
jgi:DNA-repair protein XRCC1